MHVLSTGCSFIFFKHCKQTQQIFKPTCDLSDTTMSEYRIWYTYMHSQLFKGRFPCKHGQTVAPLILYLLILSIITGEIETLYTLLSEAGRLTLTAIITFQRVLKHKFLETGCFSYHRVNSIKALKPYISYKYS